MFHNCSYCDYQSPYKGNLKTDMKNLAPEDTRLPFPLKELVVTK